MAALIGAAVVIARYGLDSFLPGLVVDFAASLAAFLLALTWSAISSCSGSNAARRRSRRETRPRCAGG